MVLSAQRGLRFIGVRVFARMAEPPALSKEHLQGTVFQMPGRPFQTLQDTTLQRRPCG
jgi:hypothetical protein